MDGFVGRIERLQASRRGSLQSVKNQIAGDPGWMALFVGDFLLAAVAILPLAAASIGSPTALVVLCAVIALAMAVNLRFLRYARRSKAYLLGLQARINDAP